MNSPSCKIKKAERVTNAFGVDETVVDWEASCIGEDGKTVPLGSGREAFPLLLPAEDVKALLQGKAVALMADREHDLRNAQRNADLKVNDKTLAALNGKEQK